ncbi:MAG: hypothetical protein WD990_14110 [Acidimicrobiia bacterium]
MMSRKTLAWAIAIWAALTWGGRIAIVFDLGSDPGERVRIGLSVLVAAAAVPALVVGRWVRPAVYAYAAVNTVLWVRSVVVVFSEERAQSFLVVHTTLALLSLLLAAVAALTVWREPPV